MDSRELTAFLRNQISDPVDKCLDRRGHAVDIVDQGSSHWIIPRWPVFQIRRYIILYLILFINGHIGKKYWRKCGRNPRDWRIDDVVAVARKYGLLIRTRGGSHSVFGFPGINDSVTIPARRPIKPIYIKHCVELIDKAKEAGREKAEI